MNDNLELKTIIIKNSCWMCSYLILCDDEKNMNILLLKLEKHVANAKSDFKKPFTSPLNQNIF